jgi:benzodiazapine receptor
MHSSGLRCGLTAVLRLPLPACPQRGGGPLPLGLYAAQLVLNLAWQPLFFRAKSFKWAKRDILALLGVLGATIYQFAQVDSVAAQLMVPYFSFCCYATALTFSISDLNPGAGRAE